MLHNVLLIYVLTFCIGIFLLPVTSTFPSLLSFIFMHFYDRTVFGLKLSHSSSIKKCASECVKNVLLLCDGNVQKSVWGQAKTNKQIEPVRR